MADLLNTALSGLSSYQRALTVVSHNISNANTPGFNRQSTELGTRPQDLNGLVGNGVQIESIRRNYDSFLTEQLRTTTSEQKRLESFHNMAAVIDDILADPEGGVTPALQSFFSALQDVSTDPSSTTARISLLHEAETMAQRFQYIDARMADQETSVNNNITDLVSEINTLATSIKEVNVDILGSRNGTGETSPDLLDKRDRLLQELSEKVSVSVLQQTDGTINVFIGNGQTLVTNNNAFQLKTISDPTDAESLKIAYSGITGTVDITGALSGGELGGVLDYRSQLLGNARNRLGRLAVAVSEAVNRQHQVGMDLNGNLGGNFFSLTPPAAIANTANTGAATVTLAYADETAITDQDYTLTRNAADWTLTSADGTSTITGAGPTLTLDGLTVTIGGGAPVLNDSFLIRPTRTAASNLQVSLTDPNLIAAAAPVKTTTALTNTGSASIDSGTVLDATNANLLNPVSVEFTSATTYNLVNTTTGAVLAAAQPYTNGANIDYNGWRIVISGTPANGDRFDVSTNSGGASDNRNSLLLGALQNKAILNGSKTTFQEDYGSLNAVVGAQTRQAEINRDVQTSLLETTQAQRDSVSGVNLDEEAADLIKYQQAYQAAARVIATADNLFQSLINSF